MRTLGIFSAILLLLAADLSKATLQTPDRFLLNGEEAAMCMAPILTSYFEENPEREPDGEGFVTSLWRGYVATFTIADDFLQVVDIQAFDGMYWDTEAPEAPIIDLWHDSIDHSFPDPDDRVLHWFTGDLYVLEEEFSGEEDDKTRYTLLRIGIVNGKQEEIEPMWTEYHGPSSGRSCSAGWDTEVDEGPTISGWCKVDSPLSAECTVPDPERINHQDE